MERLKDALAETFGKDNIWQFDYMSLVDRLQIVIKLSPRIVMGKDFYSRLDVLIAVRIILMLCRMEAIKHDLRIAFKLQSDTTVASMIFSNDAVMAYSGGYDFESIAQEFNIVKGLE